jgi:hypothetical protein
LYLTGTAVALLGNSGNSLTALWSACLHKEVSSMSINLAPLVTAVAFYAGTMTNAAAFSRSGHEGLQNGRGGGLAHGRIIRPGVRWESQGIYGEHHGLLSRRGVGRLGVFGYDDRPWVR